MSGALEEVITEKEKKKNTLLFSLLGSISAGLSSLLYKRSLISWTTAVNKAYSILSQSGIF